MPLMVYACASRGLRWRELLKMFNIAVTAIPTTEAVKVRMIEWSSTAENPTSLKYP